MRNDIRIPRERLDEFCHRWKIVELRIFGSVLREDFRPDSDLYVIYNVGSRFQSLAAGNPMQVRQEKIAVKITYSWSR